MAEKLYTVKSPLKSDGKLRKVDTTIILDEEVAGELVDQGVLEEAKGKATVPPAGDQKPPAKAKAGAANQ